MKHLLGIFLPLAILLLGVTIPTSVFIGMGYIMSYLFKLSLFNSALLCIGSVFVFAFIVFIFIYSATKSQAGQCSDESLCDCPFCSYQRRMARVITLAPIPKKTKKPRN